MVHNPYLASSLSDLTERSLSRWLDQFREMHALLAGSGSATAVELRRQLHDAIEAYEYELRTRREAGAPAGRGPTPHEQPNG